MLARNQLRLQVTNVAKIMSFGSKKMKGESLMQIKIFKDLKQYTVTSNIKKEDIDLVKKYRPLALKKKDGDGNDVFGVSYVEGKPCISPNGITFGSTSSVGGFAMVTGSIPDELPEGTTLGDFVADKVGGALTLALEFEASIPAVAAEIRSERDALINSIVEV